MARKSKHQQDSAAQTLEQLETFGDSVARWASEHSQLILGVAGAILAVAAIIGFATSRGTDGSDPGSAEIARTQSRFRTAMGAGPNDFEAVEPANPEIANNVRSEYVVEFEKLAEKYAGTVSGALAQMEVANLQEALGDADAAISTMTSASANVEPTEMLYAIMLHRLAGLHELANDPASAGRAYEAAAGVAAYPLRLAALAEAARCYASAGDSEQALRVFDQISAESPEFRLPDHIESKLRELRAAAANS